jgi:HEAT repeat protein
MKKREDMMNKYKKYFIVFLCASLVEAVFIIILLAQRGDIRKSGNKHRQENISEAVGLLRPTGLLLNPQVQLRHGGPLEPRGQLQTSIPTQQIPHQPEQSKTQQILDLTEKSSERSVRAIVSAVFGTLGRQSEPNELSKEKLADSMLLLFDKEASLKERRQAAWTLAKNGSTENLLELEKAFLDSDTPIYLKAAIVEALGYSPNPLGKKLILTAIKDDNDVVVRAAIRGLSVIGDEEAVSKLSDIVVSTNESSAVTSEAALGLGKINHPDAYNALINAYYDKTITRNDDFEEDIIAALGQRDISETSQFFQKILDENTANPSLRLAIIEAVEDAEGDTSSFLLHNLHDNDSEVRAAACWALATASESGLITKELQELLLTEEDAKVRKRLYQALGNQENTDVDATAQIIFKETDSDARLAGYDFLAKNLGPSENADVREWFEKAAVPELREVALTADKSGSRLGAVITLKRANTIESHRALEEILAKSADTEVIKAIERTKNKQ